MTNVKCNSWSYKSNTIMKQFFKLCYSLKEENIMKPPHKSDKSVRTKKLTRYELGSQYPDVYLSQREAECVALIVDGCSHLQVAQLLDISSRTVEFYMNNVKAKLRYENRKELILKIKNSDFIKKVDEIKAAILARKNIKE